MNAYVTLLSSIDYLEGVIALNKSLSRVKAKYPLYCVLSKDVDLSIIEILSDKNINYILLDEKVYCGEVSSNTKRETWDFSNWNFTFDKLCIWGLTQFEKIVFLDSDMIVVRNIDHLFDCKSFTASLAGVKYPTNHNISILNSGLMVVIPDKCVKKKMLMIADKMIPEMQSKNLPLGDQDIINAYFPEWFRHKDLILDDGYNLYAHYLQYYLRHENYSFKKKNKYKPIYVVHFVGKEKPWMIKGFKKYMSMCKRMFPNFYYMIACLYYKLYFNR